MAGSDHGLLTVTNLELFMAGVDLETKYGYTDTIVEAIISTAEDMVIGITGEVWSSTTVTDGVSAVVKLWSKQLLLNQMIEDGHTSKENPEVKSVKYLTDITKEIIKPVQQEHGDFHGFYAIKG